MEVSGNGVAIRVHSGRTAESVRKGEGVPRIWRSRNRAGRDQQEAQGRAHAPGQIVGLADDVAKKTFAGKEPKLEIPMRTKSNTIWNKKRGILEMGDARPERELFNLNQAKQFMQTDAARQHDQGPDRGREDAQPPWCVSTRPSTPSPVPRRTPSTRQDEMRPDSRRPRGLARRPCAKSCTSSPRTAGAMVGNITVIDKGRRDRLPPHGLGRLRACPASSSPTSSSSRSARPSSSCTSKRAPSGTASTKTASGRRTTASSRTGGPAARAACRRLLQRLNQELQARPSSACSTAIPWGHYIYSVIKQGSISLAFEARALAIPDAKFLGIRAKDYDECDLPRRRQDRPHRQRHQARQGNRGLSVVRGPQRVAERDRDAC